MIKLEREGRFMAQILSWGIRPARDTQAVGINMEFKILAQLDGDEWTDWTPYDEHYVYGDFYVVKKDGTINDTTVAQLAKAVGWPGDLTIVDGPPPSDPVQITVKPDTWEGVTRYKAAWIDHKDFTPTPMHADAGTVNDLQGRFGSLLRAAASSALAAAPKPTTAEPPPPAAADEPPF